MIICSELSCFLFLFLHYYFKPAPNNKEDPQIEGVYSTSSGIKIIETLKGQREKKKKLKQEKKYSHLPTQSAVGKYSSVLFELKNDIKRKY